MADLHQEDRKYIFDRGEAKWWGITCLATAGVMDFTLKKTFNVSENNWLPTIIAGVLATPVGSIVYDICAHSGKIPYSKDALQPISNNDIRSVTDVVSEIPVTTITDAQPQHSRVADMAVAAGKSAR